MAWIGSDWHIGKFVSEPKIDLQLAQDWHGLAWIGRLANLCRNQKLTPDWHKIGRDWHGLAQIGQDWQIGEFVSERKIDPRLVQDWHLIGTDWHGLSQDWLRIGTGLAQDWRRIGT